MEVKQINQLMQAMGRNRVKKLRLKTQSVELELELRDTNGSGSYVEPVFDDENPLREDFEKHKNTHALSENQAVKVGTKQPSEPVDADENVVYVTSPMVGTFYLSPSPKDAPFIKPGDSITENSVVGIIEAMKVMNEVKASVRGVVKEVLVESGHPVEFGAKLFKIVT